MNWAKIRSVIVDFFADKTRDEIVSHGSHLGIAVAPLNTPQEILTSDHVRDRNSFVHDEIAPGVRADIPNGYLEFDDQRAGFRHRAPELGEHTEEVLAEPARPAAVADTDVDARPLAGVRVLDLGVIVVGRGNRASARRPGRRGDQGGESRVPRRRTPDGCARARWAIRSPWATATSAAWD